MDFEWKQKSESHKLLGVAIRGQNYILYKDIQPSRYTSCEFANHEKGDEKDRGKWCKIYNLKKVSVSGK